MKIYLISDNTETYEGMRLSGIDGMVTSDPETVVKAINALSDKSEYAVILLTEKAYALAAKEIERFILTHTRPLITRIPDRHGSAESGRLEGIIRSGMGLEI